MIATIRIDERLLGAVVQRLAIIGKLPVRRSVAAALTAALEEHYTPLEFNLAIKVLAENRFPTSVAPPEEVTPQIEGLLEIMEGKDAT